MTEFTLHRSHDPSGVSGVGEVAWGCEFPDGAVAVRWPGEHPSTAAWGDIRDVEAIHGHGGSTVVTYAEPDRLLASYARVMPYLLSDLRTPKTVGPHPGHPDRLLVTFKHEAIWRFWVGLLDGSTYAATHEESAGRIVTTWVSPDGNLWLQYSTPGTFEDLLVGETFAEPEAPVEPQPSTYEHDEHPLTTFDREDRG